MATIAPATTETALVKWSRRGSFMAVGAGVTSYIAGLVPALLNDDYASSFLAHLGVRGVACALAALVLALAILIHRPRPVLPWLFFLLLILSYTLRPLVAHFGDILAWNGWLVFFMIAIQRGADVAAITTIIVLRQTDRITDTRIEIAMILLAYSAVVIPFVSVPGWMAFDYWLFSFTHAVIGPMGYVIVTALVARLIFIDILHGRAFQFMLAAWLINIFGDVVAHNILELSGSALGAAAFDTYTLSSFLWAAAALHPSMHEVTRPASEARGDWSPVRSVAILAASTLPLVVALLVADPSLMERTIVLIFGCVILALLIMRARIAVAAYAASETKLLELSRTDPLTGLLNRRELIHRSAGETCPLGVAYIDINDFKLLNDVHGHDYGDRLLIEIAERLRRLGDMEIAAARIGGDEFVVLFANTTADAMDRVRGEIEIAFESEFLMKELPVRVTASFGLAAEDEAPGATNGAETHASTRRRLLELFRRADIAQYYAKSDGGSFSRCYSDTMQTDRVRQERILNSLKVLENGSEHFWLDYQAIVELDGGRVVGAELLARMHSPELGDVSPTDFIPLAEKHGYITILGEWVFRTVLAHVEESLDRQPEGFQVSANVSPLQLKSDRFLDVVLTAALNKPKVASRVRIEVTKSAFIDDKSLARLAPLKAAGYSIAIDDFGSKHASLQHLARIEVDTLKLDRSFTSRLVREFPSRIIVQHVIELASEMGISVVTEEVETERECKILSSMGCRFGQGFLWDRPAPSLGRLFERHKSNFSQPIRNPLA